MTGWSVANSVKINGTRDYPSSAWGNTPFNPVGSFITPPAVPGSSAAYTNSSGVRARVFVSGGTVSNIELNGTPTNLTSGEFIVDNGESITLVYTVAPTWIWFGE
jgi:hypothetical protein